VSAIVEGRAVLPPGSSCAGSSRGPLTLEKSHVDLPTPAAVGASADGGRRCQRAPAVSLRAGGGGMSPGRRGWTMCGGVQSWRCSPSVGEKARRRGGAGGGAARDGRGMVHHALRLAGGAGPSPGGGGSVECGQILLAQRSAASGGGGTSSTSR
jgi:hypothetical protein